VLVVGAAGAARPQTIAGLQADDAHLASESRAAVLELYSIDARLTAARERLAALQSDEARLRRERVTLTREVHLARLDTHLSQNRLALRLRFMYEQGSATSLDIVMGASSIGDALTKLDDYDRLAQSNEDVLVQVQTAHHRLTQVRRELESRQRALRATTIAAADTVGRLSGLRASQASYIAGLATQRSLDAARIAEITAQAQAAVIRSQTLAAARAAASAKAAAATSAPPATAAESTPAQPALQAPPPQETTGSLGLLSGGGRTLTVVATAYDLPGHTATGLPVGWGVAAVDPSVIPLGTHFVVPGYGEAVAADTGGAIVGSRIDLWFPSGAQASGWGVRTVTISIP
jgi:3D (Asp-Asp-Asp) domain-containing protein/peptidoglycan hydrolase CwlO-like protein